MTLTVSVVVLNWNGGSQNLTCLRSLEAAGVARQQVLFVDNGSVDGSVEEVERAFPGARVLRNGENLGFCGGCNVGLRHALESGSEAVLLLNNDVVVDPEFLQPLLKALEDPGVGAVGPKMLAGGNEDVLWCAGGLIRWGVNVSQLRGFGQRDRGQFDRAEDMDYIPACALIIRREALQDVGLLDEDFFAYMEDVDYGVRLRKHGYRVRYEPRSRVVHHSSGSSGGGYTEGRKYANALNSIRFLKKHPTLKGWAALLFFDVLCLPLALAAQVLRRGNPRAVLAKGKGLLDGIRGLRVTSEKLLALRHQTESHGRSRRPLASSR